MTIINEVKIKCLACGCTWDAYEGGSTNTFGMTEEEARDHLENFAERYGIAERRTCPECGSTQDKEVER